MNKQYYEYEKKRNTKRQRFVIQELMNEYLNKDYSINKLQKIKNFNLKIKDAKNKEWTSKDISFDILDKYMTDKNYFDHKDFDLYEVKCNWLDGNLSIFLDQHMIGSNNESVKLSPSMSLGEKFPLSPTIDREGVMYNSFQNPLIVRIINLRTKLVDNSSDFKSEDWLYDLIALISNCVSIVDITLNQLYIKAEYDPLPGWVFNKENLGERYNRRFNDKIKWVHQITGNFIDDANKEQESFNTFREIRNHVQHFDPPCFGFTLEEVTDWLNMVMDIGMYLLKIRKKINSKINNNLIKLILLPKVKFSGRVLFDRNRLPHEGGYKSTCWQ